VDVCMFERKSMCVREKLKVLSTNDVKNCGSRV